MSKIQTGSGGVEEKLRTRRKLRKVVESNRKSLTKMEPKRQVETCVICLEDISIEYESSLDSCTHKYCHPCI